MVPRPQRRDREEDTVARMALSHGTYLSGWPLFQVGQLGSETVVHQGVSPVGAPCRLRGIQSQLNASTAQCIQS